MQDPEPKRLQLSVIQIVAGTFATVSAAALGSTLGVEGTLLGAAVSSVVATVAAALYTHSLEQARRRIRWRRNLRTGTVEPVAQRPARRRFPWGRVAALAGLVFALALGAITVLEVVARQPLASLVGQPPRVPGRTTVGTLLRTAPARPTTGSAIPASTATGTVPEQAPASTMPSAVMPEQAAASMTPSDVAGTPLLTTAVGTAVASPRTVTPAERVATPLAPTASTPARVPRPPATVPPTVVQP